MTWVADTAMDFQGLMNLRPNLHADYQAFAELFWQRQLLPAALLELCRLRVAQIHRCQPELKRRRSEARAAGLEEGKIDALSQWHRDERFSEAERACLSVAECFTMDPHSISDDMAARAVAELGDAGFVALLEALALFDGFSRFQVLLEAASDEEVTA